MAKKKQNRRKIAKKKGKSKAKGSRKVGFFGWFFFWPYHLANRLSSSWPTFLQVPLKLCAAGSTVGFVLLLALTVFYGSRALPLDMMQIRKMPERTTVLDRTGKEIARLHGENRTIIPLSEIAPEFEDALLAREDSRFRSHFGVDPFGIARSVIENIKRRSLAQGSSTITMQLARNTFDLQSERLIDAKASSALVELDRKFLEIAVTFRIESSYSKDEILEAYINRIFFGHSYWGIESASQGYFGKKAKDLTLSESAMLAGIIRGPNLFTPHRNPEGAKRERDTTLDSMVRENFLSKEKAEKAKRDPIVTNKSSESKTGWSFNIIQNELRRILANKNIKQGGLVVTTTLDSVLQNITENAIENQLSNIESRPGYSHPTRAQWQLTGSGDPSYLQAAVVLLDSETGAVRTVIGGRDVTESSYNRAQWSSRSAGSLFKPFVYLAAYEQGMLPETWVADTPLRANEIPGAAAGWPANSDGKYYQNLRSGDGLVLSHNASTVRVGHFAGMENVISTAKACGLLKEHRKNPTLYLGNSGATPWQLATAYTTFPNQGNRVIPFLIEKIENAAGKKLYQANPLKAIVSRPETTGLVNNLLQEVTASGTARALRSRYNYTYPAAGKTGTTKGFQDAWYAGYTSSLTGCVWVGLDKPAPIIDGGYGGTLALPIWATVFRKAAALRNIDGSPRYPAESLDPALRYSRARLCRLSAKHTTAGCEASGTAYQDLVPEGLLPRNNDYCTIHPLRALRAPQDSSSRPNSQPQRALPAPESSRPLRALPVE